MPKDYINPSTLYRQLIGGTDLAAQAKQAFRNIQTVVEASGGTISNVVSLRIYVVDYPPEKAEAVGNALRESFSGPARPAATLNSRSPWTTPNPQSLLLNDIEVGKLLEFIEARADFVLRQAQQAIDAEILDRK